jgi:mRNA interferase MazF
VFWVELNPVVGAEMGKTRPALVIQNDVGNAHADTTVIATITSATATQRYPFLVPLPSGTLSKPSLVNCAHVRTIDLERLKGPALARLAPETMHAVDEALRMSLGLS